MGRDADIAARNGLCRACRRRWACVAARRASCYAAGIAISGRKTRTHMNVATLRPLLIAVPILAFLAAGFAAPAAAGCKDHPGPNVDWSDCVKTKLLLSGEDFQGAKLVSTDLSFSDFSGSDLSGADLTGAMLTRVLLVEAKLAGADARQGDVRPRRSHQGRPQRRQGAEGGAAPRQFDRGQSFRRRSQQGGDGPRQIERGRSDQRESAARLSGARRFAHGQVGRRRFQRRGNLSRPICAAPI